jgi:hypothetical protein
MKSKIRFWSYVSQSFLIRMTNDPDNRCRENQNMHFKCNILLPPKFVPYMRSCRKISYRRSNQRWQYNTAHALCVLDNYGYRHTLRMWKTYYFSMATMALRTRPKVTLICTRPVLFTEFQQFLHLHLPVPAAKKTVEDGAIRNKLQRYVT